MPDFNVVAPPKTVTDPNGSAGAEYPKHLYKFVAEGADDTSLPIAWKGKQAIHNVFTVAINAKDEAEKIADGFSLTPVLDAPKAKK